MSYENNRLLFYLFWAQNQNKSFDEFGTLYGHDVKFCGVKLKDLTLDEDGGLIDIMNVNGDPLCWFIIPSCTFGGFSGITKHNQNTLNILDHISTKDTL